MNWAFSIFPVVFFVVFGLVIAVFLIALIRGLRQWSRNNQAPRLKVDAVITAKRTEISGHHHHDVDHTAYTASTRYYATFQVESGDRMELSVPRDQYGLLAEGDRGKLTFQGSRFLNFERGEHAQQWIS